MRSYPIPYLTLVVICAVVAAAGFFGAFTGDPNVPRQLNDSSLYFSLIPLSFLTLGLISCVFWIIALVHMLTNRALQGTDKIVWLLIVLFLNAIGGVLYFWIAPNPAFTHPPISA